MCTVIVNLIYQLFSRRILKRNATTTLASLPRTALGDTIQGGWQPI